MSIKKGDPGKADSSVLRGIARVERVLQSQMFVSQEEKCDVLIPPEGPLGPVGGTLILNRLN